MNVIRTGALVLGAVVLLAGFATPTFAQRGAPAPRTDVRGVVKSVDAEKGTITVMAGDARTAPEEKTFTLVKGAEVAAGDGIGRRGFFREIKLGDIKPGALVSLTLSADQKTVESVAAEGPQVRGVVKSVSADSNSITLVVPPAARGEEPSEKTYVVATSAEVGIDDGRGRRFSVKEGKLADIAPGSQVTLWLGVDQRFVQAILAEAPAVFGILKSSDINKGTVTVTTAPGRGGEPEEQTLELAKDAVVVLDDGRGRRLSVKEGKLADVPDGSTVFLRLLADKKAVTLLRAEGPQLPGMLKAVDTAKGTITVATRQRGAEPEEKTYPVAKDARVLVDGRPGKLEDLKPADDGPFVQLRLSLDQKAVQAVFAVPGRP